MVPSAHTALVGPGHRIELQLPEVPEGSVVSVTIDLITPPLEPGFRRQPGSAAGKVRIQPDFDDPLEEFEDEKYG